MRAKIGSRGPNKNALAMATLTPENLVRTDTRSAEKFKTDFKGERVLFSVFPGGRREQKGAIGPCGRRISSSPVGEARHTLPFE